MPAPSLFGTMRGYSIGAINPARVRQSDGLTPEAVSRTRASPVPSTGSGIAPKVSTSRAGPWRSYQTTRIRDGRY
jgi:hypothetical protein